MNLKIYKQVLLKKTAIILEKLKIKICRRKKYITAM